MLTEIHMKNFVLFDEVNVEFSQGMNVITGESGSGKSLFLSALKVLSSGRVGVVDEKINSEVEARFVSIGKK